MRRSPLKGRFAVCVKNEGYPASLASWMIYQVVYAETEIRQG